MYICIILQQIQYSGRKTPSHREIAGFEPAIYLESDDHFEN